jgi:hypothetical protein
LLPRLPTCPLLLPLLSRILGTLSVISSHLGNLVFPDVRIATLTKTRDRLAKRVARLPGKMQSALKKPHVLKEKGIFTEQARTMTRELVKVGVPVEHIGGAVKAVVQGFGVNIEGDISARSVGRITLEGGIAAQLQLVHEIQHAPGKSVQKVKLTAQILIIHQH